MSNDILFPNVDLHWLMVLVFLAMYLLSFHQLILLSWFYYYKIFQSNFPKVYSFDACFHDAFWMCIHPFLCQRQPMLHYMVHFCWTISPSLEICSQFPSPLYKRWTSICYQKQSNDIILKMRSNEKLKEIIQPWQRT